MKIYSRVHKHSKKIGTVCNENNNKGELLSNGNNKER